jgi:hypothetical protein
VIVWDLTVGDMKIALANLYGQNLSRSQDFSFGLEFEYVTATGK